jgi:hypothetical protein
MRALSLAAPLLVALASAAGAQSSGPTLEMMNGGGADDPAAARIAAAAGTLQAKFGTGQPKTTLSMQQVPQGIVALRFFAYAGDPGTQHAFLAGTRDPAVCHLRLPPGFQRAQLAELIGRCEDNIGMRGGPAPKSAGTRTTARPRSAAHEMAVPNSHPENWAAAEGVYFYRGTSFGYGGMMIMTFRPVVLFRDHSYYEIDEAPLEDLDLARERAARPTRFGRWTQQGSTFTLIDDKGRGHDYAMGTGNFFKTYPASGAAGLAGSYANVSGGGNSAVGGTTGYLADSRMNFSPDGSFTTGQSVAFSQSPEQTGVSITARSRNPVKSAGRYATDRYTLTLSTPDGRQQRQFFCFASDGRTGAIDRGMIFIGDSGYTLK